MYVCLCRNITDSQIINAVCKGARCVESVNRCFEPIKCGRCIPYTKEIITNTLSSMPQPITD